MARPSELALAAELGAIREEALIRLRRLADRADAATIAGDAAWKHALARMQRDYVTPRPADPVWADLIILATPGRSDGEVEGYAASLPECGPMAGKVAAPLAAGNDAGVLHRVYASSACAGLFVAPRPFVALAILLYFVDHSLGYAVLTLSAVYWQRRLPPIPWRLALRSSLALPRRGRGRARRTPRYRGDRVLHRHAGHTLATRDRIRSSTDSTARSGALRYLLHARLALLRRHRREHGWKSDIRARHSNASFFCRLMKTGSKLLAAMPRASASGIEGLHVQRVERGQHRLVARQELGVVGLVVQVHVPPGLEMRPDHAEELARPQRVREHVVADDQVEQPLERDAEVVEVDERGRGNAVDLLEEELLALPDRHRVDLGAPGVPQPVEDAAGPRPPEHAEAARRPAARR
jgi:hypothetical protein